MDPNTLAIAAAAEQEDEQSNSLAVILCRFADTSGYIQYHWCRHKIRSVVLPFGRPFGSFDF